MALTSLTDATAVNTLANFLAGQPRDGRPVPTVDQASEAFLTLVTGAYTKLAAGISPTTAPALWTAIVARLDNDGDSTITSTTPPTPEEP